MRFAEAQTTWTRWFNFHSKAHQQKRYPATWDWYKEQTKPIYLREPDSEVPASQGFPLEALQRHFGSESFFAGTVAFLIAFAIYEGFERIELWGIEAKADSEHGFERPCIAYWVGRARQAGIDVFFPDGVTICKVDKLYGYETT